MGIIGFRHSPETKEKIRRTKLLRGSSVNEKNGRWKGDLVKTCSLHLWIRRHLPKPDACPYCGRVTKLEVAYADDYVYGDYSHYKRDISLFRWTCHKCHMNATYKAKKEVLERNPLHPSKIDSRVRTMIHTKCIICGHSFGKYPSRPTAQCCSRKCAARYRTDKYGPPTFLGKRHTAETKEKMSLARINYWGRT